MTMNEDEQIQMLYNTLSIEQKYAYCQTVEMFLSYVQDDVNLIGLSSLCELTVTALNIDSGAALDFFSQYQIMGPLDYLKTIRDKTILNCLLYTCSVIVGQAIGSIDGKDCRELAKDHFQDWFHQLGYTDNDIQEVISKINIFFPYTTPNF